MRNIKKEISLLLFFIACMCLPIMASAQTRINESKLKLIVGDMDYLQVVDMPEDSTITWSSSDRRIVRVDTDGWITAVRKGCANITATVGEESYTCKVNVYNPKLSKVKASIKVGKTLKLKVANSYGKTTWKSANKSIATVNTKGVVTAKKSGRVVIYAKTAGTTLKCTITVPKQTTKTQKKTDSDDGDGAWAWLSATGSCYHSYNHCGRMNPNTARKVSISYAKAHYSRCRNCW